MELGQHPRRGLPRSAGPRTVPGDMVLRWHEHRYGAPRAQNSAMLGDREVQTIVARSTRFVWAVAWLLGAGCGGQSSADRARMPDTAPLPSAGAADAAAGASDATRPVTAPSAGGGSAGAPPSQSGSGGGLTSDTDARGGSDANAQAGGKPSPDTGALPGVVRDCTASAAEWCASLDGDSLLDYISSIAQDPQGHLVVLGRTQGSIALTSHGALDVFVAKYTVDGQLLWVKQHGAAQREIPSSIAVDASGNIVFGYRGDLDLDGAVTGAFVTKLTSSGDPVWTRQFGSEADGGVATDADGNVLFVGSSGSEQALAKFSPSGDLLWSKPQLGGDLAVDAAGAIIVSPQTGNTSSVAKLSPSGDLLWKDDTFSAAAYAVDPSGNVFCLGESLVRRYSSTGTVVWDAPVDSHLFDVNDIALDGSGNVFIIGMSNEFHGNGYDGYVAKYSADGKALGGKALGVSGGFEGFPMVAAGNGQLFIAGPLLSGVFVAHMSI
jgi:hypothetical protein